MSFQWFVLWKSTAARSSKPGPGDVQVKQLRFDVDGCWEQGPEPRRVAASRIFAGPYPGRAAARAAKYAPRSIPDAMRFKAPASEGDPEIEVLEEFEEFGESEALARLRPGHLVARAYLHKRSNVPYRWTFIRVTKAERLKLRAGPYWWDRSGRCEKATLKSFIRPLTVKVRAELSEFIEASPFAAEVAELGPDAEQFREPLGLAALLTGDAVTIEMANGIKMRDSVSSVTAAYIYVGPYYFDRFTGDGVTTKAVIREGYGREVDAADAR